MLMTWCQAQKAMYVRCCHPIWDCMVVVEGHVWISQSSHLAPVWENLNLIPSVAHDRLVFKIEYIYIYILDIFFFFF